MVFSWSRAFGRVYQVVGAEAGFVVDSKYVACLVKVSAMCRAPFSLVVRLVSAGRYSSPAIITNKRDANPVGRRTTKHHQQ